jgi:mitogen-activated protein kinase kinase 3
MPLVQGLRIQLGPLEPGPVLAGPNGLGTTTTIRINNQTFGLAADELEVVCELGRGAYGDVQKMRERGSGALLAVKRIRYTMNTVEQQRTAMDMDIAMRSLDCPYTVHFYGAMFRDGDVWICMEVMDTCLDRLYRRVAAAGSSLPESVLALITWSVVSALDYLHRQLKVMHRDVKPSNILASTDGSVKLCDFGISAYLVDSIARTRDAGTSYYLAPERIEEDPTAMTDSLGTVGASPSSYTVRADVWSLGITLLELAEGRFPYPAWHTPFEQLRLVVEGPAPRPAGHFSAGLRGLVSRCLEKRAPDRADYKELLHHHFLDTRHDTQAFGDYVREAMETPDKVTT